MSETSAKHRDYRILVVCMGNICRSPTAKGFLDKHIIINQLESIVKVDSAGTHSYHIGHSPDDRSQAAARRANVDISTDRSRKIRSEDFYEYHEILVMDSQNMTDVQAVSPSDASAVVRLIMDDLPEYGMSEVPDPYYGGESGFVKVVDMLDQVSAAICQRLLKQLQ